jgi:hypothetical protein
MSWPTDKATSTSRPKTRGLKRNAVREKFMAQVSRFVFDPLKQVQIPTEKQEGGMNSRLPVC